jgi:hypothetical protein
MATITGYTAARMQAIEDGTVTTGLYDASGHLILTKHDGTQIDVGRTTAATTAQSGIVELATNAETQAGTDATRAITPAGLASLSGYRVQIVSGVSEAATPAAWPYGVSLQSVTTGSGWSLNSGTGTIVTSSISSDYTVQEFYSNTGSGGSTKSWQRSYTSAAGWSSWAQRMLMVNLDPTAFNQTTARGNYPVGQSRLYYTTANGTGWDFSGTAGEIITYCESDNTFGRQVFTAHVGGSSTPFQWFRTANAAGGWTAWQKVITDPGPWTTWTPTWSTTSGLHLPSFGNAVVSFKAYKIARKVDVQFDIAFGSSTNFGATPASTDNWTFSLPAAWPASSTAPGTFLGIGDMYRDKTTLGFTRIKLSGTTAVSFGILSTFVASALDSGASGHIGGDVDSISPWTWASGDVFRGAFTYESAS